MRCDVSAQALLARRSSPSRRLAASFDLAARCPLDCAHCYFHAAGRRWPSSALSELSDAQFLDKLLRLELRERIGSALWLGGEPLLHPRRLVLAARLFPRNAVVTSGVVPIPPDLPLGMGVLVSVDGPAAIHDRLRGRGCFDTTAHNLKRLPRGSFALMMTLTASSVGALEALPALVDRLGARGALVGFFVGPPDSPFTFGDAERERAVDRLLRLKGLFPTEVLNSPASIEAFRPTAGARFRLGCPYRKDALAFDAMLEPKRPCSYGRSARCEQCGCPLIALRVASDANDTESLAVLRALFPKNFTTAELSL